MTKQDLFQGVEQRSTLFAQGREVSADATKGGGSGEAAKAAGNLLLDLDHAQVPFSLVIVKGHRQIGYEGQHGVLLLAQPIQQVACSTLFGTSFSLGWRMLFGGLSDLCLKQDGVPASQPLPLGAIWFDFRRGLVRPLLS